MAIIDHQRIYGYSTVRFVCFTGNMADATLISTLQKKFIEVSNHSHIDLCKSGQTADATSVTDTSMTENKGYP